MPYIDVSQWNGVINWGKVEADGVFIRVGYRGYSGGVIVADKTCEANLKGASQKGIPIGLYFMSQAISESEAAAEALYCLDICKRYKVTLPIVYDSEYSGEKHYQGRADNLTKIQRTNICNKFCETIAKGGHFPGVYSSTSWYTAHLIPANLMNRGYFIWCAQHNTECKLTALEWHLWQYSSKGRISGISGDVDLSKTRDGRKLEDVLKAIGAPTAKENTSDVKIYVEDKIMTLKRSETKNARFYIGEKTTNFRPYEFACHNGADTIKVDGKLIKALQKIREHFGKPVSVTSGYRTEAYNKKVGGATNSYHVKGMAADITVTGVSNIEVAKYAATFLKGVGLYNYKGGFVHVDMREKKYFWKQDSKNSKYYGVSGF